MLPLPMLAVADEEHAPPGPDGFTDEAAAERDRAERERKGEPAPALAPALCWCPAQVAADLALAKQLMATVDKEKGVAENPLLPQPAADAEATGDEDEGAAGGAEQAAAAEGEQAAAEGEGEQQAPAGEQQQQQDSGSGPADMDAELSPEEQLAKLDQVGWRVLSSVLLSVVLYQVSCPAPVRLCTLRMPLAASSPPQINPCTCQS